MANVCPALGIKLSSDITWGGQPYLNQSVTVTAKVQSNPTGASPGASNQFCPRPGRVHFRWCPAGWTGNYCQLPDLKVAAGETNPVLAKDPVTNKTDIEPNSSLPATIDWIPDVATCGGGVPRGGILAQVVGVAEAPCCPTDSTPADCSPSTPGNQLSGTFKVLTSTASVTSLFSENNVNSLAYVGFVIPNTDGNGRRIRVAVSSLIGPNVLSANRPFGAARPVVPDVRVGLGKNNLTLSRYAPFAFVQPFFAGFISAQQYEEVLDPYATPTECINLDPQAVLQGLLQIALPPGWVPSYCLLDVKYVSVDADGNDGPVLDSFTVGAATDGTDP